MSIAQNQPVKSNSIASQRKHRWHKGALIIGVGLTLMGVVLFYIVGGSMAGDKTGMERYLQDKYSQEFKVADLKDKAVSIGYPGQRVGIGHPVSDSSLKFEVGKNRKTGTYFDGYSGAVWAREERPEVAAFLQTVYKGSAIPSFDLITHIPTAEAPDPIRGKVPSIDDALARYKDNFFYSVTIKLTTHHELSQNEIENHTANMKEVIKFIVQKNVSYPMIRYAINIEGKDTGYLCNLSQSKLTDTGIVDTCLTKINGKVW